MSDVYFGPPLRPLGPGQVRDWFFYATSVTFTATGQVRPATIVLDGTAPFELTEVAVSSVDTGAPTVQLANVMAGVEIKDTAVGYTLGNVSTPVDHFATTQQRAKPLNATHIFRSNATIQLTVTNLGIGAQQVFITLLGFKHITANAAVNVG